MEEKKMKRISMKLLALALCCLMLVSLTACDMNLGSLLGFGGDDSGFLKPGGFADTTAEAPAAQWPAATEAPVEWPTAQVQIPAGYAEYNDGYVSFAYPEDWTITSGTVTILSDPTGATASNIALTSEPYSTLYETMTAEDYMSLVGASYQASGLIISDVQVDTDYTGSGEQVTVISHNTSSNGISMVQALIIIPSGGRNCVVTITEQSFTEVLDVVMETLRSV